MRRALFIVAAIGLLVGVLPLAASASHSNGRGPNFQKANGTGFSEGYGRVHVNAKNREGPSGRFFIKEADAKGEVTCFGVNPVTGEDAVIGGFDRTDGRPFLILVHDEGSPGREGDAHAWRPATPPEVLLPTCNPVVAPPDDIERGNYIVHSPQS